MRFQEVLEKDLSSNKINVITVKRIPKTKYSELVMIPVVPFVIVDVEKGEYHRFYVPLQF